MARRETSSGDGNQSEFLFDIPAPEEKLNRRQRRDAAGGSGAVAEKPVRVVRPAPAPRTAVPAPAPAAPPKVAIRPVDVKQASPFETLLHGALARIYNLCLRLTQDAPLADDLTLEVFVRAAKTDIDETSPLRLVQETISIFRRERRYGRPRRPVPPPPTDGSPARNALPVFELPDAWAGISDEHRTLLCALGTLDADDRVMIVLKDLEDLSYPETAEALDVSEGSARDRVAAARERMHVAARRINEKKRP